MFSGVEDDDLFNPTSTSNLASLFGTSNKTLKQDKDASLTYTAPKQPKTSGQETPKASPKPSAQSAVICSKFVDVFKLLERIHVSQGKCGLAIIGNDSLKTYELIIYKSKQDIIMRTRLSSDFIFTIQDNNFAHFYDDQKQQWSIHFENAKEIDYFVQKLEACGGKTANNITNSSSTSEVDKKPQVEKPSSINLPTVPKDNKDSDSQSDNHSSQTKANILSRMAKMGQAILPTNLPQTSSDRSESENDEQKLNRKVVKKRQKHTAVKGEYTSSDKERIIGNTQLLSEQATPIPEFVMINGQILPISAIKQNLPTSVPNTIQNQVISSIPNQIMLSQPQISSIADPFQVFIAENRTHNCEIRMNMTQLSSKIDNILDKLNKTDRGNLNQTSVTMESHLAEELERNKALLNSAVDHQNELQEALLKNQTIIDNLKQQCNDQEEKILEQRQKITELEHNKQILEEKNIQHETFQQQIEEQNKTIVNLKQTISDQEGNLKTLTNFCEENEKSTLIINELNNKIINLNDQLANKNSKTDVFAAKLKQSMNMLYQQIMENFEDESTLFKSIQIKQILSQKLKAATLTIIQEFHSDLQDTPTTSEVNKSNPVSSSP